MLLLEFINDDETLDDTARFVLLQHILANDISELHSKKKVIIHIPGHHIPVVYQS